MQFKIENKGQIANSGIGSYLQGLDYSEQAYAVKIEPWTEERSDLQNSALFGVAYPPIMKAMGLRGASDKEDLHEYMCGEYFGWKEYEIMGKRKVKPIRTTTRDENGKKNVIPMSVMSDLYGFVQQKAAENGIYVPDPDPLWWREPD